MEKKSGDLIKVIKLRMNNIKTKKEKEKKLEPYISTIILLKIEMQQKKVATFCFLIGNSNKTRKKCLFNYFKTKKIVYLQ